MIPTTLPEVGQAAPLRVALVEDNEDVRLMMGEVLETWGHEVSQAATGALGVQLIIEQCPDIAFIDIGLPDMDGYELARQVRARLPSPGPMLVALSGFGQRRDRERASLAGFDDHLAKPASPVDLKRLLHEARRGRARDEAAQNGLDTRVPITRTTLKEDENGQQHGERPREAFGER